MTNRTSRRALTCALFLATTALGTPALAQVATGLPPAYRTVDDNGVDLVSGFFRFSMTESAIGSGEGAIPLLRHWGDGGYRDNWSNGLYLASSGATYVTFGDISDRFQFSGGVYVSQTGNGATLVLAGGVYTYTAADGTQIVYRTTSPDTGLPLQGFACVQTVNPGECGVPVSLTRPNGMKFTLNWDYVEKCTDAPECTTGTSYYRFAGVSSAAGYGFTLSYLSGPGTGPVPQTNWYVKTGVTFSNAVAACTAACPSLTYANGTGATKLITDALGRQWQLTQGSGQSFNIRRPGETSDSTIVTGGGTGGSVASVTRDGVAATYARTVAGSTATTVITDPLGKTRTIVADLTKGRITSVTDELSRVTSYQYDASNRLTRVTEPEGNYVQLAYDARGNVTSTTRVAKSGSGLANIVTSASFPASCTNPKTCNQPTTTTDARGKVSDYTYNATHGGVLTVTAPAPTTGAVRPKMTFGYTLTAAPVAGNPSVYLLTSYGACQTLATCAGAADQTGTVIAYGANMLPASTSSGSGNGALVAVRTATYDPAGNLLTLDGPLAGAADTTRYRYDNARRLVGTVGPDPDGAGARLHRAVRLTLRPDSQVSRQELGTVTSQTDAAWAAFAPAETVDITYNANARVATQKLSGSAGAVALTQFNYDALGRPDCAAQRMNPAIYASLPASACSLGTAGSHGPDRIGQTVYDFAG